MHMLDIAHIDPDQLDQLGVDQLRELVGQLLERSGRDAHEIGWRDTKIDKLTFEVAQLKRLQYGAKSEQLSVDQRALFDEAVGGDIAAIEEQIAALKSTLPPKTEVGEKKAPKRGTLPAGLPRVDRHHEPETTTCTTPGCGCTMSRIGEDVSEKLDYTPGVFSVERHVRGKWVLRRRCASSGRCTRSNARRRALAQTTGKDFECFKRDRCWTRSIDGRC